jgi:hypothetical protein
MDYLGLFCLGAFVGTVSIIGVRLIKSVDEWQKVLLAILPVVLSGVTITFVDRFKYSPAIGCYPLGLVAALMWIYVDQGVNKIIDGNTRMTQAVGWLHIISSFLFTVGSLVIASIPAWFQIDAEATIPNEDRKKILAKERDKSLTIRSEKEDQNPKSVTPKTPASN